MHHVTATQASGGGTGLGVRAKSVPFQSRPCKQQRDYQAWLLFYSSRGGSMGEREQQVVLL